MKPSAEETKAVKREQAQTKALTPAEIQRKAGGGFGTVPQQEAKPVERVEEEDGA